METLTRIASGLPAIRRESTAATARMALWYRGVNRHFDEQAPGVYRHTFTERAKIETKDSIEGRRLRLERDTVSQFRSAGAAFLEGFSKAQIYFVAQHFGMPTRLLDWSTNPLAALFFACDGQDDEDGFVLRDGRQARNPQRR